jgi:hypothetical protein
MLLASNVSQEQGSPVRKSPKQERPKQTSERKLEDLGSRKQRVVEKKDRSCKCPYKNQRRG